MLMYREQASAADTEVLLIALCCTTSCLSVTTYTFYSPLSSLATYAPHRRFNREKTVDCFKYSLAVNVSGSTQRGLYTGNQLEYALFVHSLCILGKVLIYKNGRALFPIKVMQRKGTTPQHPINCHMHNVGMSGIKNKVSFPFES